MPSTPDRESSLWGRRAQALLQQALAEVRNDEDAIGTVDAALTALRIEAGELPADAMADYPFPAEQPDQSACICPPELLARGGFRGGCPVHG